MLTGRQVIEGWTLVLMFGQWTEDWCEDGIGGLGWGDPRPPNAKSEMGTGGIVLVPDELIELQSSHSAVACRVFSSVYLAAWTAWTAWVTHTHKQDK